MNGLSASQAVLLVAKREFVTQTRSRSFVIGLVVTLVIFGIYGLVLRFIGDQSSSDTVGVTPDSTALAAVLQQATSAADRTLTIVEVDRAAGEQQVRDDDLDALLTGAPGSYQLIGRDAVGPELQGLVEGVMSRA
ncbi:MAG: ABC-type Na+ efflux pump permease component [Pseudonocardia sp.]|uniref:hypothetical protein n=1 Tax=Pseudonocardia sp. TaxID=60912 RepID=UPI0026041816|nr:hypothetical protein [Pseudonocardia sp.]MCU1630777.1 ABC-type Na+ efflux pump permease component [Pseudonocardia sp.]